MTQRELQRLSRAELLELLLETTKENEKLRKQLEQASIALADRVICMEKAGSIAEAAMALNRVFEAAQAACDQYTQSVMRQCGAQQQRTQALCNKMLAQANMQTTDPENGVLD